MAVPSKKEVLLGIVFVIVGLAMALFDRWQAQLIVPGYPTRKPHVFNHIFFVWFIRQLLQFSLLFLWMAIDKNWMGFAIFRHGEIRQRESHENQPAPVFIEEEVHPNEIPADHAEDGNINPVVQEPPSVDYNSDDNAGQDDNGVDPQFAVNNNSDRDVIDEQERRRQELDFPPAVPFRPRRRQKKYTKMLYFPPAFFEVSSVLLVYFGMQLTYTSSFCMLKGSMAFFAALLSIAFLAQQLPIYVWFGVVISTLSFVTLGISDYVHNTPKGYEKYGIAAGDLQIVMGQIMFATKLIFEEKFIRKHSIHPMKFLGSEASYGIFFASVLLLVFNLVDGVQYTEMPNGNVEDIVDACWQIAADWRVAVSFTGSILCFIVYTYLGIFLVRDQGALPRIMVELLVWSIYWAICLALGWEQFYIAQIPGFVGVLLGLLLFSHILIIPFLNCCYRGEEMIGPDDEVPLLGDGHENDDEMLNLVGDDINGVIDGGLRDDEPLLAAQ